MARMENLFCLGRREDDTSICFLHYISIFMIFTLSIISFSSDVNWSHRYGGANDEEAYAVQQTSDGGYILAGYTDSYGAGQLDFLVIKLDYAGNITWQKTYGRAQGDVANSIQQLSDGNYIVCGNSYNAGGGGGDNIWVLKLDALGAVLWQKYYNPGTAFWSIDYSYSIMETSDGGFILAGQTDGWGSASQFWVARLDGSGTIIWQKAYYTAAYNYATSVKQIYDGGFIVAGRTDANSGDVWVLRLDGGGNVLWQHTYGTSGDQERAEDVIETPDGFVIIGPTTTSGWGTLVFKIDSMGVILWQEILQSSTGSGADGGYSIKGTLDGFILGSIFSVTGYTEYWVVKLDVSGNILWQKATGASQHDYAYSVSTTSDGGFISAGTTSGVGFSGYDILVLKHDSTGNIIGSSCVYDTTFVANPISLTVGTPSYSVAPTTTTGQPTSESDVVSYLSDTLLCSCLYPTQMATYGADNDPNYKNGVTISWQAPTDWADNGYGTGNRGFRVYRDGVDISGLLSSATLSYNDGGGNANQSYWYYVDAINGCGNTTSYSGQSAMDSANVGEASPLGFPMLATMAPTFPNTIDISYTQANCAISHNIYWGNASGYMTGYNWTECISAGNTGTVNFMMDAPPSGSFNFIITVGNNGNTEGSYGKDSSGVERTEATVSGCTNYPQNLNGCP